MNDHIHPIESNEHKSPKFRIINKNNKKKREKKTEKNVCPQKNTQRPPVHCANESTQSSCITSVPAMETRLIIKEWTSSIKRSNIYKSVNQVSSDHLIIWLGVCVFMWFFYCSPLFILNNFNFTIDDFNYYLKISSFLIYISIKNA